MKSEEEIDEKTSFMRKDLKEINARLAQPFSIFETKLKQELEFKKCLMEFGIQTLDWVLSDGQLNRNASICDEAYVPNRKPIVVEV